MKCYKEKPEHRNIIKEERKEIPQRDFCCCFLWNIEHRKFSFYHIMKNTKREKSFGNSLMNICGYFFSPISPFSWLVEFCICFASQADAEIKLNLIFYNHKTENHKFLLGPMLLRCSY
jgi:hypothetical protein